MGCDCKKTYNMSMGCCVPTLGPIENYYTKYQTELKIEEAISGITVSGITEEQAEEMIEEATSGKANSSDVYTKQEADALLADKQDKLTAGTGIDITNNVISVTGGSQPVDAYTKAETDALLNAKVNVVDNEVPDYNVTKEITYQGGYPSQSETASTWDAASMFTLRYNYIHISDTNYIITAAVIDPSNNIITGRVTTEETIGNPLSDYIDMSFSNDAYRFTAKEGYRIAHLDIYISEWATWGYIREERVETVFEGGQSADVIKDVIEPTLINKQDALIAGENITISDNVISATDTTYLPGDGISITNNVISTTTQFACVSEAEWETISGNPQSNTVYLIY